MTHKHSLVHSLVLVTALIDGGKFVETDAERFLIFSDLNDSIYQLYLRIRRDMPHCTSDSQQLDSSQSLDETLKKQICGDISYDFGYDQLKIEEPKRTVDKIQTTEEFTVHTTFDDYLRKTFKERGFVCKLRTKFGGFTFKLLISTEYNLNTSSSLPADRIVGRFVYSIENGKNPVLYGLAEVPAKGVSSPEIDVESNYLEKKNKYMAIPDEPNKDPLCGMKTEEKLRICFAVFRSSYFNEELEYTPSVVKSIDGSCVKKTITLRTYVKEEKIPRENQFNEWLLSCARKKENPKIFDPPFDYFISHAYEPNALFVYKIDRERDELIFLENLSTKVRINVDVSKFPEVSQIKSDVNVDKLPQVSEMKNDNSVTT